MLVSAKHPAPVERCKGALLGRELARCNDLDLGFGLVARSSLAVLNFPEEKVIWEAIMLHVRCET